MTSDTGSTSQEPGRLYPVAFQVPDTDADEFDAWYEEEHVGLLMDVPGWLRVRRYRMLPNQEGPPMTHLALHELAGPEVLAAPKRERLRTEWRARLAAKDWFRAGLRWLYRPIAGADGHHLEEMSR